MWKALSILSLLLGISGGSAAFAQDSSSVVRAPHVEVELIAPTSVPAGHKAWFAVAFRMEPHWHIYWKNPGDSGAAPKFKFLESSWTADPVRWPVPQRIPLGDLTNFGYEGEAVFPFEAKLAESATGSAPFRLKLEWLVCREECVPGFATFEKGISVGPEKIDSKQADRIAKALLRVPAEVSASGFPGGRDLQFKNLPDGKSEISWISEDAKNEWQIFPVDGEKFPPKTPEFSHREDRARFVFTSLAEASLAGAPKFVIARESAAGPEAFEIDFSTRLSTPPTEDVTGFWILLFSAFVGGMLLNLMPCVFPVLSIKVFSFMKAHEGDRSALAKDGILYTLGTLMTFAALGALFLVLRQGGQAVGWGFQLQSPILVFGLSSLFFVLALNFLGVFEWGTFAMNWAGLRSTQGAWTSAFGTGVLSVLIAAPCTGPFMGAALGAATTLPSFQAMLIFLVLGLGLAVPLLILCLFPAWLKKMPRPGAWMNTLKEFFAFPLFGTVVWLLWVLAQQTGADGVLWATGGFVLMAFGFWIAKGRRKVIGALVVILAFAISAWQVHKVETSIPGGSAAHGAWSEFDEGKIAEARAQGQAVFVDFTAAWCITCQWNKKSVLETGAIQDLFRSRNVLLIRADWTQYDERITKALAQFGRASVPVYAYYAPGAAEAQILPQLLTTSMIEELFQNENHKED